MFTVTAAALDRLSTKLACRRAADGQAFRFTQRTGGWGLRLDQPRPDDTAFSHEGRNVLLLDSAVAEAMAALTLDARGTEGVAKLKLDRSTPGSDWR